VTDDSFDDVCVQADAVQMRAQWRLMKATDFARPILFDGDAPWSKQATVLPVSQDMLDDVTGFGLDLDSPLWDRAFRPWRLPDRNPMPAIDLVPTWLRHAIDRAVAFRGRARDALQVLRGQATIGEDGDW